MKLIRTYISFGKRNRTLGQITFATKYEYEMIKSIDMSESFYNKAKYRMYKNEANKNIHPLSADNTLIRLYDYI
jgi:hypothetical protein